MEETSSPAAPAPAVVESPAPTSILSVLTSGPPDVPVDPAVRFRGLGTNFKAKLIGIDDVPDSRGDEMCQGSLIKLKAAVLAAGRHKQKVVINVSLEGIKIVDILTGEVQHVHPVHRISFIARDLTDRRAFGYVYGAGEGKHQFFGIKTMKVAEVLVLALRDLFQVVFDMKKKEIEEAKKPQTNGEEVNEQKQQDVVYAVPNKQKQVEPVQQPQQPQKEGNLFDLEQQLTTIQEGINNIDSIGPWSQDTPTSPDTPGFGGDNNGGDLFGIASNASNGMPQKTSSYSDELFDLASPVAQPVPQPGARLTKEQILSSFGGAPQGGMYPGQPAMMPGQQGMMPGQPGMMQGQPGMMPGQPGMMRAQFGQSYQQQPMGMPQSVPAMNMFPQGPSPAIPPRPGAMRPAAPQALSGGAQQNPFGDAVAADGIMMPMSNTVPQSTDAEKAGKSDPFANLTSIGGSGAANKKDMFKNFQMAKAPQPPPRTNPPVSSPVAAAAPAEQSTEFDNYFLSSVGGVPVTEDVNPTPAPRQQPAANDPFGMGLGGGIPPAATTTASSDPFASNQGFSQPFEFN